MAASGRARRKLSIEMLHCCYDSILGVYKWGVLRLLWLSQLYERYAAERWIRRHARVPHSPETAAFVHSLRHCPDMDRLLRAFRAEFGLAIEYEAG